MTEVVHAPPAATPAPLGVQGMTEEQWVHRIMQRVDQTLDRRLREAVAAVIVDQTRNLAPLLRAEVESVVREAVADALAGEMNAASLRSPKP
nr:hypothetical protein [Ramlibacter albus]